MEAENFFEKSLDVGVEGLMFKNLESEYKPGLRSGAMAKLKETKEDIDVIILGAEGASIENLTRLLKPFISS